MYRVYINSGSGYGEPLRKDNEKDTLKYVINHIKCSEGAKRVLVIERYKKTDYIYGVFFNTEYSLKDAESRLINCRGKRRVR